jgi:ATP-dependent helicase/nuclease subunit B
MWAAYEEALSGRFLDGEDEARDAIARIPASRFLNGSEVWAYGFELASRSLAGILMAISGCAGRVTMSMALEDKGMSECGIYEPVRRSIQLLSQAANGAGVKTYIERAPATPADAPGDITALERGIFDYSAPAIHKKPESIQVAALKNPAEEAMFAAATARRLVRTRGWRWRDVTIAFDSLDAYGPALSRACALYDVPLFLEGSTPANRYPIAEYIVSALDFMLRGWQRDDAERHIGTGYTALTADEGDRLINYAIERGLTGNAWKRPLRWGEENERAEIEPLREKFMAPLMALEAQLGNADTVTGRLAAIWGFMEETGAHAKLASERYELAALGMGLKANEAAQVWNRVVETFDQMRLLLGDSRLGSRDLCEMFSQSLAASTVKPLPQSADAA